MWEKFKQDFKERFLTFETMRGIYMVPAGIILIFVTIFYLRYLIQATGIIIGFYMVAEGLRKIFVNRIKQKVERDALLKQRLKR